MTTVSVNTFNEKEIGNNKPCVLKFPQGLPPPSFVEQETEFVSLSKKVGNKRQRVILSNTDKLEYQSEEIQSTARYAIGVYDKSTNTLKIVPTDIYDMKQSVIGYTLTLDSSIALSKEDRYDQVKKLADSFGSKVTKKKIQKMEMENVDNLDFEKTNKAVGEIANTLADKQSEETPLDLPYFDLTTSKPEAIYPHEAFIPPKVYFGLYHQLFFNMVKKTPTLDNEGNPVEEPKLADYFKEKLDQFASISEDEDLEHACKLLTFMWYALMIMQCRGDSTKLVQEGGASFEVKDYMVSLFSTKITNKKISVSREDKTKIINFMVIVHLHLEGFETKNIAPLAKALAVTETALEKHFTRIGCKRSAAGFRLQAPLTFPTFKENNKKR
ncbi:hypothetical protein CYY_007913 [Polysphondylium violaceum]|uniref:RNA polymerase I subunit n=1 Tax=Polysphondylium violaceum TaxID=133409 RepID=A0A8J4PMP4_9MYCE|nr:hypothetical protein CYY_007913 [Polysphondylium violaceum]